MSEWKLRMIQKEIHWMHVARLTIEERKTVGRGTLAIDVVESY